MSDGPSSAELTASGAMGGAGSSSAAPAPSNLGAGDASSAAQALMPPVVSSQGLSVLGADKSGGLGSYLQSEGLGVLGAGGEAAFETDLNTVNNIAPGNVALKMVDDVNGLGSMELSNVGIAKQVNGNLPQVSSGQAAQAEH